MSSKHFDWKNTRAKAATQSSGKFRKNTPFLFALKSLAILTAILGVILFVDLFSDGTEVTSKVSLKDSQQAQFGIQENHLIVRGNGVHESIAVSQNLFNAVSNDEELRISFSPVFNEVTKVENMSGKISDSWSPKLVPLFISIFFLFPLLIFTRQSFQESIYFVGVFLLFPLLMSIKYWAILVTKI